MKSTQFRSSRPFRQKQIPSSQFAKNKYVIRVIKRAFQELDVR